MKFKTYRPYEDRRVLKSVSCDGGIEIIQARAINCHAMMAAWLHTQSRFRLSRDYIHPRTMAGGETHDVLIE